MNLHNNTVHFSLFNNCFDNKVTDNFEVSWYEFVDMIEAGHKITGDKNTTLFGPWKFKSAPARRLAEDVESVSMVCFDFDGEITIDAAKSLFATYEHVGYTSYSHNKNGVEDQRFRIVVPLTQSVQPDMLASRRKSISSWANGVDLTSLYIGRCFYVPSCPAERKDVALVWTNNGELFNVEDFEEEVKAPVQEYEAPDDEVRRWIVESMHNVRLDSEPEWFQVGACMASNGFTLSDFIHATAANGGVNHQRDCEKKWSGLKGRKSGGIGLLINILKRNGILMPARLRDRNKAVVDTVQDVELPPIVQHKKPVFDNKSKIAWLIKKQQQLKLEMQSLGK